MRLKPGMLLVLETGEYSDYTFHGPFVVLREFDQVEAVADHRREWKPDPDGWRDEPDTNSFTAWLAVNGYIEHAENVVCWHIGSYGRLEAEPNQEPVA